MLILASSSEGRIFVLEKAGIIPDKIEAADIDEAVLKNEPAHVYVQRLAQTKAEKIHSNNPDSYVIGADTIVCAGKKLIGKPKDAKDEEKILKLISGRKISVLTGHCVIAPNGDKSVKYIKSRISMKRLSTEDIQELIDSNEWQGVSGGIRVGATGSKFIKSFNGSYTNIIGLCVYTTNNMLKGLGYKK